MRHTAKLVSLTFIRDNKLNTADLADYGIVLQMPISEFLSTKAEDVATEMARITISEDWRKEGKRPVWLKDILYIGMTAWAFVPAESGMENVIPLPAWPGMALMDMGETTALTFAANVEAGVYG